MRIPLGYPRWMGFPRHFESSRPISFPRLKRCSPPSLSPFVKITPSPGAQPLVELVCTAQLLWGLLRSGGTITTSYRGPQSCCRDRACCLEARFKYFPLIGPTVNPPLSHGNTRLMHCLCSLLPMDCQFSVLCCLVGPGPRSLGHAVSQLRSITVVNLGGSSL